MSHGRTASPLPTVGVRKLPVRITSPRQAVAPPPRSETAGMVGGQIKALRMAALTSGGELAARARISRSLLSRVERGLASPSIQTLERIAEGLGVPVSRFFAERTRRVDMLHVAAGQGIPLERQFSATGCRCEFLGQLLSGNLSVKPCLIEIDAPEQVPGAVEQTGLKFVYVLAGRARFRYGVHEVCVGQGDALLFDASLMHGMVTTEELPVRYLSAAFSLRG